ncbi:MAG: hypothetical protein DBY16_04270 [Coprobacter sp.]|nr:MAG: hypothetical protein DBY16_04270 [Coprobacter sp.]
MLDMITGLMGIYYLIKIILIVWVFQVIYIPKSILHIVYFFSLLLSCFVFYVNPYFGACFMQNNSRVSG